MSWRSLSTHAGIVLVAKLLGQAFQRQHRQRAAYRVRWELGVADDVVNVAWRSWRALEGGEDLRFLGVGRQRPLPADGLPAPGGD